MDIKTFRQLSLSRQGEELLALTETERSPLLRRLGDDEIVQMLKYVDPDEATEILRSVALRRRGRVVRGLSAIIQSMRSSPPIVVSPETPWFMTVTLRPLSFSAACRSLESDFNSLMADLACAPGAAARPSARFKAMNSLSIFGSLQGLRYSDTGPGKKFPARAAI